MRRFLIAMLLTLLMAPCIRADSPMPLTAVKTFMYQLQNLEEPESLSALAKSPYDLLVVEPTGTIKGNAHFDMKAMVSTFDGGALKKK